MTKQEFDEVIAKITGGLSRVSAALKASAANIQGGLSADDAQAEYEKLTALADEVDGLAPDTTGTGTQEA